MRACHHSRRHGRRLARVAQWLRAAAAATGARMAARIEATAQARIHRTAIEIELHEGRFKHATKNDDDIPRFV